MTSTVYSEFFGMAFWFDEYNDLMYAPSFVDGGYDKDCICLLYTSPSPRDRTRYRMPSSA